MASKKKAATKKDPVKTKEQGARDLGKKGTPTTTPQSAADRAVKGARRTANKKAESLRGTAMVKAAREAADKAIKAGKSDAEAKTLAVAAAEKVRDS